MNTIWYIPYVQGQVTPESLEEENQRLQQWLKIEEDRNRTLKSILVDKKITISSKVQIIREKDDRITELVRKVKALGEELDCSRNTQHILEKEILLLNRDLLLSKSGNLETQRVIQELMAFKQSIEKLV